MTAPRRPYRHGNVERDAVDAGLAILAVGGPGQLTLRRVAARVGVSHGALYRHFADRDALLDALAVRGFEGLATATQAAGDADAFTAAYLAFAQERGPLYDLMMARPNARFAAAGPLRDALRAVLGTARRAFGQAATDDDIVRAWMILHGGLSLRGTGIMRPPHDADFAAYVTRLARVPGS